MAFATPEPPSRWEEASLVGAKRGSLPAFPLDVARSRFPFALVWCPLPGITWLLPVVGHLGICDSRGVVTDFAGPYHIGVDGMAFSRPYLYLQLDPALAARRPSGASAAEAWDAGVDAGCDEYSGRMHNICCDNCHSHVARCLNEMRYGGRGDWGMVSVGALVILRGKWVSAGHAVAVWVPFCVAVALVAWLVLR
jgi:hypothetical protein